MPNMLGGRSLVAIGLALPFTLGIVPATSPVQFLIEEPGVAGVLILPQGIGRILSSLRVRGQELISGVVPFSLFASDNPTNPLLGYAFDESTRILFNAFDPTAAAPAITPTITATRMLSKEIDRISQQEAIDSEWNAFGRSAGLQLAIGPAAQTAVLLAGTDVEQQMVISRPGSLGHLHISPEVDGLDVVVVEIQNDGIINGQACNGVWRANSFASPGFGHKVTTSTIVKITIRNNTGAPINNVIACYTMLDTNTPMSTLMDLRQAPTPNPGDLGME